MERDYLDLLRKIITEGDDINDRTGVGTRSLNGLSLSFPVRYENFPLITTKQMPFRSIYGELLWFLSGSSDVRDLAQLSFADPTRHTIWDDNVNDWQSSYKRNDFDAGANYGVQWRLFEGCVDQIQNLLDTIKNNPTSRRHVVTAWNPNQLNKTCLPPCHILFQCHVINGRIDMTMYQRSADMFLGVPFNISSYSLLLLMICHHLNMEPGKLTMFFGDAHIYKNHFDQVELQLTRQPYDLPQVSFPSYNTDFAPDFKEVALTGYKYHPRIKAEMAV